MLPGAVGSRWMPRKMAGIAMITIDVSMVAIVMLTVVLERATHLYLLSSGSGSSVAAPRTASLCTARTLARLNISPVSGRERPGCRREVAGLFVLRLDALGG